MWGSVGELRLMEVLLFKQRVLHFLKISFRSSIADKNNSFVLNENWRKEWTYTNCGLVFYSPPVSPAQLSGRYMDANCLQRSHMPAQGIIFYPAMSASEFPWGFRLSRNTKNTNLYVKILRCRIDDVEFLTVGWRPRNHSGNELTKQFPMNFALWNTDSDSLNWRWVPETWLL